MKRLLIIILGLPLLLVAQGNKNKMEIVFCTDLSGSTNGLIRQFNNDFWTLVNTLPKDKSLKIGLIAYGRRSFPEKEGYTKEIAPLTKRFDALTYSLLKLPETTEGADAYIDNALERAITQSIWSKDTAVQKEIILIGNGGFRADRVEKLLELAAENRISVRAIYYQTYINLKEVAAWQKTMERFNQPFIVATNALSNIQFKKNYDQQWLINAGEKLKETYVYYGNDGKDNFDCMDSIDHYAQRLGESAYEERLLFKCSAFYQGMNSHWDLVDLYDKGKIDFASIDKMLLPEFLQEFSDEQLKNFITLKSGQRQQILQQISLEQAILDAHHQRKQLRSEQFQQGKSLAVALLQWFG